MMRRIVLWATGAFILVPVAATLVVATSADFSQGPWGGGATLDWLAFAWAALAPVIARSLLIAATVVAATLVLAFILGMWIARRPSPLSSVASVALNLPLAVPGIAVSVALVATYPELRPSGLLLVCAHIVFTLPFALGALVPVLRSARLRTEEEVAGSLGAGPMRVLATITVPAAGIAIAQAAAMVFALSFGEFNISFFVNPPATPTIPFALFDAYATQRLEFASAQTALFLAVVAPVLAALVFARHLSRSRKP
ncbi:MAG: ABC transporter permease [Microbacterium sp.]